jgi:hypothetical protein
MLHGQKGKVRGHSPLVGLRKGLPCWFQALPVVLETNREASVSPFRVENVGGRHTLSVVAMKIGGKNQTPSIALETNRGAYASPLHVEKGGEGFNPSPCFAQVWCTPNQSGRCLLIFNIFSTKFTKASRTSKHHLFVMIYNKYI